MLNGSIQRNGSENDRSLSLHSSSECIAWLTVLITESVAIVTLNILTLIVFIRNRSLRKRSMYLVINLAVADMLAGGFTEPLELVEYGDRMCKLWRYKLPDTGVWGDVIHIMKQLFPLASQTNLAAIALERMHATFRPFKHRAIQNWVLGVVIMVTWVTSGLFSTATILTWRSGFTEGLVYVRCSLKLICLFIIFVSYTFIVVKVYCGAHPLHHGAASRERKLAKTLFIVTLVSLITLLPSVVIFFSDLYTDTSTSIPKLSIKRLGIIVFVLYFANSLVNPILYTIRMPEFRRTLVSLF